MPPHPLSPTLRTARLLLRPWLPDDAAGISQLIQRNHSRFVRDFPRTLGAVHDEISAQVFITLWEADWQIGKGLQLGIFRPDGDAPLGFVSLRNLEWEVPKAELAYLLDAAAEGQGLMHEALAAVLDWAFRELGLARACCHIDPDNERSARLARRCGLQLEGRLRLNFRGGDGQLHDSLCFALTRPDWLARSAESA